MCIQPCVKRQEYIAYICLYRLLPEDDRRNVYCLWGELGVSVEGELIFHYVLFEILQWAFIPSF